MACERHVRFQPAGSRPVSPNDGRLCPLADGAGECEARASSNAGEEIEEEAAEIPAVRPQAVPAGPSERRDWNICLFMSRTDRGVRLAWPDVQ